MAYMYDLGSAVGYLLLDTKGFQSGVKTANSELKSFLDKSNSASDKLKGLGSGMQTVGTSLTKFVTLPILGAGTALGAFSMNFEDAMAKVNTIADTTKVPLSDLKDQILDLSDQTGIAAADIAQNVYDAISAGQDTADAVAFVGQATKLATAGFTSSAASLDILTTILNAYNMEAEESAHVSDVLITTQNLGKTTVDQLSQSMGRVIPIANSNKVSVEQLGTAYAILTANGIATAEAGTYLKGMFNELGKSGTDVSDILKKQTGKSFQELMSEGKSLGEVIEVLADYADNAGVGLSDLFGSVEAGSAALTIANKGAEEFNSILNQMTNSAGATETAYEKMQTTSWKLKKVLNELKNAAIELGDALMEVLGPMIESVAKKIESFAKWFKELDDSTKQMIVKVGLFVAVLGPVMTIIGKLVSGIGSIVSIVSGAGGATGAIGALGGSLASLAGPIAIVIGVVAALVAAWVTDFGEIREATSRIFESIKTIISTVMGYISEIWESNLFGIQDILSSWWEGFEAMWSMIFDTIAGLFEIFALLIQGNWEGALNKLLEIFNNIWTTIIQSLTGFLDSIVNSIISLGVNLYYAAKDSVQRCADGMMEKWTELMEWISFVVNEPVEAIKSIGQAMYDAGVEIITFLGNGIMAAFENVKRQVEDSINWILSKVRFAQSEGAKVSGASNSQRGQSGYFHSAGLDYVPYDGYTAILHEGEAVLTKQQNQERENGKEGDTFVFNSPKAISEIDAARRFRRVKKEIAEGFF